MKLFLFLAFLVAAGYYYLNFMRDSSPPNESPIPLDCISWSDGCNSCFAKDGKLFGCSKLYCEFTTEPGCVKYKE